MKEKDSGAILVYCEGDIGCVDADRSVKPGKDGMHSTDVANKKFFFPMVTILLMGETRFHAPNKVWILKEVGNGYFTFELVKTGNIFNSNCNGNAVKGGLVANIFVSGSLGILEEADTVPVFTCFPETVAVGFGVNIIVLFKVLFHVEGVGLKFIGDFTVNELYGTRAEHRVEKMVLPQSHVKKSSKYCARFLRKAGEKSGFGGNNLAQSHISVILRVRLPRLYHIPTKLTTKISPTSTTAFPYSHDHYRPYHP